ncbi:hypothetical protein VSVS12_03099 [Vibrio scophthalmi]|nr:hypothetical protein VSVS12_03099 [Vibrio scophthalmi]
MQLLQTGLLLISKSKLFKFITFTLKTRMSSGAK